MIHETAIVHPGTQIGDRSAIGPFSIIGQPYRPVAGESYGSGRPTSIGANCYIGSHVVIGQGSQIHERCIIEDGTVVEVDVSIGANSHLLYRAQICNDASIGDDCVIGGFVCERADVGPGCRIFGQLVHRQLNPTAAWDDEEEEAPVIEPDAFIGFGAKVIGQVRIGRNSYVCAGAILTRDLPQDHVGYGTNEQRHFRDWNGDLSRSPVFLREERR